MGGIKSAWKEVKPIKFIAILISVFVMDYIIMDFILRLGYMDWLWKCVVDLCSNTFFAWVRADSANAKDLFVSILNAFIGIISATGILIILWDIVPNIICNLFGVKGKGQGKDNAGSCECN